VEFWGHDYRYRSAESLLDEMEFLVETYGIEEIQFEDDNLTQNKKRAKEFVRFAMQDENLTPYVEGALGRWYPVKKAAAARPFWTEDPHRKIVHAQFSAGTVPFEFTRNWKFTILNNENVWAKAVNRVVVDKWTPEKAVDEMIARIKQVAG